MKTNAAKKEDDISLRPPTVPSSLLTTNHPRGAQSYPHAVFIKKHPTLEALSEDHHNDAFLCGQRHGL